MVELSGDPDLAQKTLGAERGRELGRKHFDGHPAVVFPVDRQVDRAHPPTAELTLDRVAAPEGGGKQGQCVGQAFRSARGVPR